VSTASALSGTAAQPPLTVSAKAIAESAAAGAEIEGWGEHDVGGAAAAAAAGGSDISDEGAGTAGDVHHNVA